MIYRGTYEFENCKENENIVEKHEATLIEAVKMTRVHSLLSWEAGLIMSI